MLRRGLLFGLMGAVGLGVAGCSSSTPLGAAMTTTPDSGIEGGTDVAIVVQDYSVGLSQLHPASAALQLSVTASPELGERILTVKYPAATSDAAARDMNCDAINQEWSSGSAITFQIKPALDLDFSLSFLDRNGVAYTSYMSLHGGVWQAMRVGFADIEPNAYFQPPGAPKPAPKIDVSRVTGIGFAPQDMGEGSYAVGEFVVR